MNKRIVLKLLIQRFLLRLIGKKKAWTLFETGLIMKRTFSDVKLGLITGRSPGSIRQKRYKLHNKRCSWRRQDFQWNIK